MNSFWGKIKVLIIVILGAMFFVQNSFAYQATEEDTQTLNSLKLQLIDIIGEDNEDLWSFYYQIRDLQNKYQFDAKIEYMLTELKFYLRNIMQGRKQQAKILSKAQKTSFVNKYKDQIQKDEDIEENCIGWYNTLDDIAFSYDYPTSVLIATRYRESNCGYYLPRNGDGPFQIVSKDYGTGEIDEATFVESVVDFIEFNKNKYSRYEGANSASGLIVDLSYTGVTITGIVRHGALYNGLSGYTAYGDALPLNPHYVWDNYGEEFSGATRFGLFPQTVRIMEWELSLMNN